MFSLFPRKFRFDIVAFVLQSTLVVCTIVFFIACNNHSSSRTNTTLLSAAGINKINHIIVIYLENHSFDNLYGEFPGANGLASATPAEYTQVDSAGMPYAALPQPWN